MSDAPTTPNPTPAPVGTTDVTPVAAEYVSLKEIEKLPPEMKTVVSMIAGFFRSTTGPDPETTRIVAETERHEETCKLEGYKETLKNRDAQNERDHKFRIKKLNHDTAKSVIVTLVCVAGIITGLYLLVARNNPSVGTPLLVASFMALIGGRSLFPKDKE